MTSQIDAFITRAAAIGDESAQDADALGFMARCMVLATMPHRAVQGPHFQRTNGDYTLTLTSTDPELGLPFGHIPRLLLAWMVTEAVRNKSPELELGDSLSGFMRELGMEATGGSKGSIRALRNQAERLFSCNVRTDFRATGLPRAKTQFDIAPDSVLWWDAPDPAQRGLWQSVIRLSDRFYKEIITRPVPVDLRVLRELGRSPLAIDIYTWSTYKASYTKGDTFIPWESLMGQFGGHYGRLRDFKAAFLTELGKVAAIYQGLKFDAGGEGMTFKPSNTHVRRVTK